MRRSPSAPRPFRERADSRASSPRGRPVPAAEPLGVGNAGLQDPDHGQRRQGHPLLRVPLRRRDDGQGGRPWSAPTRKCSEIDGKWLITSSGRSPDDACVLTGDAGRHLGRAARPRRPGRAGESARSGSQPGAVGYGRSCSSPSQPSRSCWSLVAVLGLRVLGQSNARIESLGTLQLRATTYQDLQTQAQQLRQDAGFPGRRRPERDDVRRGQPGGRRRAGDSGFSSTRRSPLRSSQLGPATNEIAVRASCLPLRTRPPRHRSAGLPSLHADAGTITTLDRWGRRARASRFSSLHRHRQRPRRTHRHARHDDPRAGDALIAQSRDVLRKLAKPVRRRGRGEHPPRDPPWLRPLPLARRPDPGAPRAVSRRSPPATSRGTSRSAIGTSSAPWRRT